MSVLNIIECISTNYIFFFKLKSNSYTLNQYLCLSYVRLKHDDGSGCRMSYHDLGSPLSNKNRS